MGVEMSEFKCEPYIHICKARCCGVFPIEEEIFERNKDKIVEPLAEIQKVKAMHDGKEIYCYILSTYTMQCAFVKPNLRCNIYDDRPLVCRRFGVCDPERFPMLHCPFQLPDGTIRNPAPKKGDDK